MSGLRTITRLLAAIAVILLVLSLLCDTAHAEPLRCRRTIAKASAKYLDATVASFQKCADDVLRGLTAGPCPDADALARVARATAVLQRTIAQRCGGADAVCGAGTDDEPLAATGWDLGTCPEFMGDDCVAPIADCDDVGTCLACATDRGARELRGLFYDDLSQGNTDKHIHQCQRAIGESAARFARVKARTMNRCHDALLRSRIAGPCPNGRAVEVLARAEARMTAKICRACGGANDACGDGNDLDVALVGARATCPAVTVPDGPACEGPIGDVRTLLRCVDCLSRFATTCLERLAVPGLAAYPDECKQEPTGPTPSASPTSATPAPTATAPTPTATAPFPTATPTDTGAAAPSATPTPVAVCNDGIVDLGEVCDFPDVGCAAGELCVGCVACVAQPVTCLNGTLDSGETCEMLDNDGCAAGQVCIGCATCQELPVACGNGAVDAGEACEIDGSGCDAGDLCVGCLQCISLPTSCGNGSVDPDETCEMPNTGCNPLQICLLCQSCVGL